MQAKTRAGVGASVERGSFDAGKEAATAAVAELDDVDILLVFGTTGYDQKELLAGVRAAAPGVKLTGCSGEGVIAHGDTWEDEHACAVMAIQSKTMSFVPFLVNDYTADVTVCAERVAEHAAGMDDIIGVLLFPDGLTGDCTGLLDALAGKLPTTVVAGGLSGDAMRLEKTYQYLDETIASDSVAGVIVRGRGRIELAVSHGCGPIGLERTITKTGDGWIQEIDGEPAWEVFKEYLDGEPTSLSVEGIPHLCIGLPLEEEASAGYAPLVVRTPMGLNADTGALFFPGGGLEEGARMFMTRRDPERIKESAVKCAERVVEGQDTAPSLVLQFDCCGRGKILFGSDAATHIVEPLREVVGNSVPWLGFHCYGEIATLAGRPFFHNYTVALCALYDEPAPPDNRRA